MTRAVLAAAALFAAPAAWGQPPALLKDAEPLPEVPKADPNSELTALNKEKTLYLEKKPDGTRRVLLAAQVCLREGPLEVFLCKARTKEHEAVVRADLDAQFIHAALVAAYPGAEAHIFADLGHNLILERPEEVAPRLAAFLRRTP